MEFMVVWSSRDEASIPINAPISVFLIPMVDEIPVDVSFLLIRIKPQRGPCNRAIDGAEKTLEGDNQ